LGFRPEVAGFTGRPWDRRSDRMVCAALRWQAFRGSSPCLPPTSRRRSSRRRSDTLPGKLTLARLINLLSSIRLAHIFQEKIRVTEITFPLVFDWRQTRRSSVKKALLIAGIGFLGISLTAFSQKMPGPGAPPGSPMGGQPALNAPGSRPPTTLPGRRVGPPPSGPGRRVGPPTVRKSRRVGRRAVRPGRRVGPPRTPLGKQMSSPSTPGRRVGPPTTPIR